MRHWMLAFALGALAWAPVWTPAAEAQEWTRFRGPNGSGQSETTTIPASWSPDEVRWTADLPGKGNASPVLWGDKLFLTSANPDDGTRLVLCLSAADGRMLWQREYASTVHPIHQANTLASSTPAVDDRHVYCAWSTPEEFTLLALDHTGTPVWKADLGPFASQHGFGTSPILYEDTVIIANDQDAESFVIAVDRGSGATRWKVPRAHLPEQNTCYSTPCLYKPPGRPEEVILCSRVYGVSAIDPRTGATLWDSGVLTARAVSSPIVVGPLVLATCGSGAGKNLVAALAPYSEGTQASLAYKVEGTTAPYVPCPVAKEDLVFLWGDRGIVSCIDAASGAPHWRQRVGGNYYGSPIRVADCVYCISDAGEVVAVAASKQFKLLGRSPLGETSRSTPAVALGRMFLRSESRLVAVGRE